MRTTWQVHARCAHLRTQQWFSLKVMTTKSMQLVWCWRDVFQT